MLQFLIVSVNSPLHQQTKSVGLYLLSNFEVCTESCSYVVVDLLPVVLLSPPGLDVASLEICKERKLQQSLPICLEDLP